MWQTLQQRLEQHAATGAGTIAEAIVANDYWWIGQVAHQRTPQSRTHVISSSSSSSSSREYCISVQQQLGSSSSIQHASVAELSIAHSRFCTYYAASVHIMHTSQIRMFNYTSVTNTRMILFSSLVTVADSVAVNTGTRKRKFKRLKLYVSMASQKIMDGIMELAGERRHQQRQVSHRPFVQNSPTL
eukprot:6082-Heterococcus_DN1.PRE.3